MTKKKLVKLSNQELSGTCSALYYYAYDKCDQAPETMKSALKLEKRLRKLITSQKICADCREKPRKKGK